MIGQTISHYKILEKLGEGGMGVVYKAEDEKLGRNVALKFLAPELTRDPHARARFMQEARAAAALSHPNICTIHEIDEYEGQFFIAMECCEGETLAERIAKDPLPVNEAIDIATQIAHGLAKAHEQDIVHRDIKPANIFITHDNQVKVVDFGLAKLAGQTRLTRTGTTVGTVAYMSPEQTSGANIDHRTDIWSFGVILYEMLSGQLPFRGEIEAALMYSVVHEDPKPLSSIRADVPEELVHFVAKTLEKNPDDRYQDLEELIEDLYSISTGFVPPKIQAAMRRAKLGARKRAYLHSGVAALSVLLIVAGVYYFAFRGEVAASIAVLPFEDLSPQKDQEYFCDGLTDELINRLTNVGSLRVPARTSSFSFKDREASIQEIGRKLNVGTVLEGSLRKAGARIRITVQLVKVDDGYPLWSEKYEGGEDDIFALQDSISLAIVGNLMVELTGEEKTALGKQYTEDREAYNWYLKGRYHWNERTEEDFQKALGYFQLAIDKDPAYALAYAGMADCYNLLQVYSYLSPKEALPKAREAAEKALELDSSLAEAHTSLAWVKWSYDLDWSAGEKEFKRALELNPNYSVGHHWYGVYLLAVGRHAEALAHIKRAEELDPLSPMISTELGSFLFYGREYDLAMEHYYKTLEMAEDFVVCHWRLAIIYAQKEMYDEAAAATQNMKRLLRAGEEDPLFLTTHGYVCSLSGRRDEAEKVLNDLIGLKEHRYISSAKIAWIYMGLGQSDKAFEWLEKAYEEQDFWMAIIKVDPVLDRLRSDPRFKMLLKRMNLG